MGGDHAIPVTRQRRAPRRWPGILGGGSRRRKLGTRSRTGDSELQTVALGGDDPGAPADGPGRSDHHVLAEHDIRVGKAVKEPVINHCLSAFPRLLRRLEHRSLEGDGFEPSVPRLR
jgi:hypothetical protein